MKATLCVFTLAAAGVLAGCSLERPTSLGMSFTAASLAATDPTSCTLSTASSAKKIGPAKLYPKSSLTTGCADTLDSHTVTAKFTDNCSGGKSECTYSQSHRDVSSAERQKIYDEYNVPSNKRNIQSGEVDHLFPLCAGGSNDPSNLWYQPANNSWKSKNYGYHEKDELETHICKEITTGKMDPKVAFEKITHDWVAFYQEEGLDKNQEGKNEEVD